MDPGLQDVSAKVTQLEDWDYILVGGFNVFLILTPLVGEDFQF